MKKLAVLALPLLLGACTGGGDQQNNRPYTITIEPLGYSYKDGVYTVPSSKIELYSAAGAPDVRSIDYTAVALDSTGARAVYNNSVIVPRNGTMFGAARGGYACSSTPVSQCTWMSLDANFVDAGPLQWSQNKIFKALLPWEWAIAHNEWRDLVKNDTASWYAEFTFTAVQTNGNTVVWKQRYQIVSPATTAN